MATGPATIDGIEWKSVYVSGSGTGIHTISTVPAGHLCVIRHLSIGCKSATMTADQVTDAGGNVVATLKLHNPGWSGDWIVMPAAGLTARWTTNVSSVSYGTATYALVKNDVFVMSGIHWRTKHITGLISGDNTMVAAPGAGRKVVALYWALTTDELTTGTDLLTWKSGSNSVGSFWITGIGCSGRYLVCNDNEALILNSNAAGTGTTGYVTYGVIAS